jgi:hypothetical protein
MVSYKGETVTAGMVAFYGAGDKVASAPIGPDGTYEATDVPTGHVKVSVTTPPPHDPNAAERAKSSPMLVDKGIDIKQLQQRVKVVPVPRKFNLPGTSGISLTVNEGSQPFDIELK